jgi:hydroxymethylglutaryl-CoA reductase
VAVVRALSQAFSLALADHEVSAAAFEAEKVAHATPSGVDNALATYERPLLFRRGEPPTMLPVALAAPLHVVIGLSHEHSSTASMVRSVAKSRERQPALVDDLFARIDALALAGKAALEAGDVGKLGQLMNINHGLLHALDLSTAGVEDIVLRARAAGALGAKMTGGGGGGAVVAVCPAERSPAVRQAIADGGYRQFGFVVSGASRGASKGAEGHVQAG